MRIWRKRDAEVDGAAFKQAVRKTFKEIGKTSYLYRLEKLDIDLLFSGISIPHDYFT